jgi:hypothetical protein
MNLPLFQGRRWFVAMVDSVVICMIVSLHFSKKTSMLQRGASNTTNVWYQDGAVKFGFTPVQGDFAS